MAGQPVIEAPRKKRHNYNRRAGDLRLVKEFSSEPVLRLARAAALATYQPKKAANVVGDSDMQVSRVLDVPLRTIYRWKSTGVMTWMAADRAATALGLHPIHIWGYAWIEDQDAVA